MALVNARSVNKLFKRNDRALINLILNNDLDVLLITETWLPLSSVTNGDFRRILPLGYEFLNDPRTFSRGGGVAIVFSPAFTVRHVYFNLTFRFEYVAASLRRHEADEPILILNIYRPPAATHNEFFNELRTLFSQAFSSFRLVIIGGDFNIWVDRPDLRVPREFQTLLEEFGLVQRVSGPTHGGGHTLDLVMARPNVTITGLSVQTNGFSDHSTVLFNVTHNNNVVKIIKCIRKMVQMVIKKSKKKKKGKRKKKRDKRNKHL